jgi:Ca2+-binding RTX toxin-like protein
MITISYISSKKILIMLTLSLLILSVSSTGFSMMSAWANDDDRDGFDRRVERSSDSDALSNRPHEPEENTKTGNNDGDLIEGTSGDDNLIGTFLEDRIRGYKGQDIINGAPGADTIRGDSGDDSIQGGIGADQIYGDDGNDILSAGFEDDYVSGGSGNDELYGFDGDDTLKGGSGKDYFDCGLGFDIIVDLDESEGDTHSSDCELIYSMQ